jgi:hypothetical protein
MAAPRKNADDRLVSRTYRAAIRIGEDFITLEETITLPVDATDDEVSQAVDLGLRIYHAQREAVEAQIAGIRESIGAPAPITVRDPDAPASDKQRTFITNLQDNLGWTSEQMAAYAREQSVNLVNLTKGQASTFIDGLKKISEERAAYGDGTRRGGERSETPAPRSDGAPINEKQIHALERLAQQHGFDLDAESRRRFGVVLTGMTADQASTLLRELQRPSQHRRGVGEPAL